MDSNFTLGIEEEVILTHCETGLAIESMPDKLLTHLNHVMGDRFSLELHTALVEIKTPKCDNLSQLDTCLRESRQDLIDACQPFKVAPLFASSHPVSSWKHQPLTGYVDVIRDVQTIGSQLFVGGMHIHIGVADPDLRLKLQYQLFNYLPVFLALSTSSPFFSGLQTGLMSYRTSLLERLPRSGLPPYFKNFDHYRHYMQQLIDQNIIDSPARCWWHVRPHLTYPTLELRICDVCTNVGDSLAIAALYQSLIAYLVENPRFGEASSPFLQDNLWQARRYGLQGLYFDQNGRSIPLVNFITTLINQLKPIAREYDSFDYLSQLHLILKRGTSSHQQLQRYQTAMQRDACTKAALQAVTSDIL